MEHDKKSFSKESEKSTRKSQLLNDTLEKLPLGSKPLMISD
jgi:hypothetical protein